MNTGHTFSAVIEQLLLEAEKKFLYITGEKNRMIYYLGPSIRLVYAARIGDSERLTLEAEAEAELAKKLAMRIQSARNRKEPFDADLIRDALTREKDEKLASLNNDASADASPVFLTEEQADECTSVYKSLLPALHPALHPEATSLEKKMYEKLDNAYKSRSLFQLRQVASEYSEYLRSNKPAPSLPVNLDVEISFSESCQQDGGFTIIMPEHPETDYTLAQKLLPCFSVPLKDRAIFEKARELVDAAVAEAEEIDALMKEFPFNAAEALQSDEKILDFLDELNYRKQRAQEETERYNRKINALLGG